MDFHGDSFGLGLLTGLFLVGAMIYSIDRQWFAISLMALAIMGLIIGIVDSLLLV